LAVGASLAQVGDMAYSIYAEMHDPAGMVSLCPGLEGAEGRRGLERERALREQYAIARHIIAKCVRSNIGAIKAHLWRPGGRLVASMMES
jgi:hypothetical protein